VRGRSPDGVASEGRRLVAAALTAVLVLSGLASAANRLTARQEHHPRRRSFVLTLVPGAATVAPGQTTRLRVVVYQRGYRAPVRVRVTAGLPAHARATMSRSRLAVATSTLTRPGTYRITVAAVRPPRAGHTGRRHFSVTFRLTVKGSAARSAFVVAGDAPGRLAPGASAPLDVSLHNPNRFAILVRAVSAGVAAVSAPHADAAHPCAASDFAATPLAASYGIAVPARATVRLSELGVDPSRWPHVAMLDRPANQDGCKGATLRLSYTGTATKAPR